MKGSYLRFFIGAVLVIASVMFLGATQDWWEISTELNGALGMLLAIPALVWIFFLGVNFVNCLIYFTSFGLVLWGKDIIVGDNWLQWIISLIVLTVGMTFLGSLANSDEDVNVLLRKPFVVNRREFFEEAKLIPRHISSDFNGLTKVEVNSSFTKCGLTLAKATFDKNCNVIVKCKYGSLKIVIPKNTHITINASQSFGKVINRMKPVNEMSIISKINLDATVVFGKIILLNPEEERIEKPAPEPVAAV